MPLCPPGKYPAALIFDIQKRRPLDPLDSLHLWHTVCVDRDSGLVGTVIFSKVSVEACVNISGRERD